MNRIVAAAALLILGVQAAALTLPDRSPLPWLAGATLAVALLALRWHVMREPAVLVDESRARDPEETLRRWVARTQTLVSWADSSRADWDKHLRPMLARQFELATGQRKSKNPEAYRATARMVFGDELWRWVDPDDVALNEREKPGPGRDVLDELLKRLERI